MADSLSAISTRHVTQTEPASPAQVRNNADGFTFAVDNAVRLRRFLTLGVEGGTYYVGAADLAKDNAAVVLDYARNHTVDLVAEIVTISEAGRAPKQNPALFALAAACSLGDEDGRRVALLALPRVARTGTHLFLYARYVEQFRGWGPALRRAVANWYLDKPVADVAYQAVKYRQREGWTHRDLLRLAHPKTLDPARRDLFNWICGRGFDPASEASDDHPASLTVIEGYQRAQAATTARQWADLVATYGLSWEMLPDAALNEPTVWEALLDRGLPQTALLRQLPRLTRLGLLASTGSRVHAVAGQVTDPVALRRARVHPMAVLVAQRIYAAGHSARGTGEWTPSRPIVDALDKAFYASYGAITPTGKRTLLALDVSGSMTASIGGMPLSCREASAALALVTANTETDYEIVGFTSDGNSWRGSNTALTPLAISPRQRLDDAVRTVSDLPFGGTDCALPMLHALSAGLEIDTFVVYTDSETWAGRTHPHQALRQYRERTGIDARLVVVGMTATEFSIADPDDAGMLDVAGFDLAVPSLISDFARGE